MTNRFLSVSYAAIRRVRIGTKCLQVNPLLGGISLFHVLLLSFFILSSFFFLLFDFLSSSLCTQKPN